MKMNILSILTITLLPLTFSQDTTTLKREKEELIERYMELQRKIDTLDYVLKLLENQYIELFENIFLVRQVEAGHFDYNELINERKSFKSEFQSLINSDNFPHELPLENFDSEQVVGFGTKIHPIFKTEKFHSGIDIPAPIGTIIKSTISGIVVFSGRTQSGKGIKIVIENDLGIQTKFAHLDRVMVEQGEIIETGQPIGTVGNSGVSIAPHLHYEILINGKPVNPIIVTFDKFTKEELEVIYTQNGMSID